MNDDLQILLIEDSEDDALLIERVLKKGGLTVGIKRVSTEDELRQALETQTWEAILCDYMMPRINIKDAMKEIEQRCLDLPFIIVSGTISDEVAVEMMKAGAHDYLTKNNLSRLVPAIEREISEAEQRKKRRAAEKELLESERRHRMLVESLIDTVFVIKEDGELSEFYSQTGIIPGVSSGEYTGRNLTDLLPPLIAAKYIDTAKEVIRNSSVHSFEHSLDVTDSRKWFSINMSPHEDGKRAVVVMRDISALKKAEEEAHAAHNVALLYQDITGHDIRNYLQAIMIASDLLYTDETDPNKISMLDHINSSVSECSDLIASVQSTATLISTPLEKVSLDFSIKSCIDAFVMDHTAATIEKRISKAHAVVQADHFLNHLIMNLLSNAYRHNKSKKKTIWVELTEIDNGYEVIIADDGPGISDPMKKNLLNPERRSGGIGIHQCVQIIKKYGGTFEILDRVEGDFTQGAKIRFWIPSATN